MEVNAYCQLFSYQNSLKYLNLCSKEAFAGLQKKIFGRMLVTNISGSH